MKLSGAYTNEPVYGDLVRHAIRLGFKVVSYEMIPGTTVDREETQARNLADRIFKDEPEAKAIVHAGYAHINETGTLVGNRTMAQRLKEFTGIDPVTIDQTVMTERSSPRYEHALYRHVADELGITSPTIFRSKVGGWWTLEPGKRDVTLFQPRSVLENGRPTWLRLGGLRTRYPIPGEPCGEHDRCLVEARLTSESEYATPVDRIEVVKGEPNPDLLLSPGEYDLLISGPANEELGTSRIQVK